MRGKSAPASGELNLAVFLASKRSSGVAARRLKKMGMSAVSFAVLKSRLEYIHAMMAGCVFCPGITAWIS
jgi:hypothetical protein